MWFDFRQCGNYADAKTFLAERNALIEKQNAKMQKLHDETRSKLLIFTGEEDILLDILEIKATTLRSEDDRQGHINGTYVNDGPYHIEKVCFWYGEGLRASEKSAIKWISVTYEGKQSNKSPRDFEINNRAKFWGFDDQKMSWGKKCFFLHRKEYELFKKEVTQMGVALGVINENAEI